MRLLPYQVDVLPLDVFSRSEMGQVRFPQILNAGKQFELPHCMFFLAKSHQTVSLNVMFLGIRVSNLKDDSRVKHYTTAMIRLLLIEHPSNALLCLNIDYLF